MHSLTAVAAPPLCLGLHVTKCAGTSLITTLRRALSEDEYYFCSSYYENWLASRPVFATLRAPERLRIVFGHYCHETLLSVFADRPVYLFTGVREPVARAVSGYRQIDAVRVRAGRDPLSVDDYVAGNPNPICAEVLRCFASLESEAGPAWERARTALSMFDLVYATETFGADIAPVLARLGLGCVPLARDNVSDEKSSDPARVAHVEAACREIRARAGRDSFLDDDLALHDWLRPHLGCDHLRRSLAGQPWARDRAAFVSDLPSPGRAHALFCRRERDFLVHEFDELGRLGELRHGLATSLAATADLLDRANEYGHD